MIRGDDSQIGGGMMKGSTLRAVGGRFSGGCVELANNLFPGNDFG